MFGLKFITLLSWSYFIFNQCFTHLALRFCTGHHGRICQGFFEIIFSHYIIIPEVLFSFSIVSKKGHDCDLEKVCGFMENSD